MEALNPQRKHSEFIVSITNIQFMCSEILYTFDRELAHRFLKLVPQQSKHLGVGLFLIKSSTFDILLPGTTAFYLVSEQNQDEPWQVNSMDAKRKKGKGKKKTPEFLVSADSS